MVNKRHVWKTLLLLVLAVLWISSVPALASEDDNSLASLGILTEGAEVSPELTYGVIEYDVKVPAGTTQLQLDPVPTASGAWIADITGTELVDGKATVEIVVSAANGDRYSYFLYVTADGDSAAAAPAEAETEAPQTETEKQTETEPETEDPRYVKVDRNVMEEANNTITVLKTETSSYRSRVGILTKILYGMIAFCVILLFIVINLLLKKKDLKAELKAYRGMSYPQETPDDYANGQDYNGQAYKAQGYQGYENQGYENQGYENQGYENQGYENQGYGDQGYENQASAGQGYSGREYNSPGYDDQGRKPPKPQKQKRARASEDDPAAVPKPEKAKKQKKAMPEYQQPAKPYEYQQPAQDKQKDNTVEVTMIDL